ncbi:MAG TPA: hypothetical protein VGK67_16360 [Myxococcales bacterium]
MSAEPLCHRCLRPLAPGALKFSVRLAITADFDGHLAAAAEESASEADDEASLVKALAQAAALSEEELLAGVHQEVALLVCADCRRALLAGLAAAGFLRDSGAMVQ